MKPLAALFFTALLLSAQAPIRGFPNEQWTAQHALEEKAGAMAQPENIGDYIRRISAEPHEAGSPRSRKVAEELLGLLRSWGLDAHIEEFEALMPTPKLRVLEMVSPSTDAECAGVSGVPEYAALVRSPRRGG